MRQTSRNVLMLGGALIVIALLLTYAPLEGLFGGAGGDELPAIAAGPKADAAGPLGAVVVGAAAGAKLGRTEVAALAESAESADSDEAANALVAGAVVAGADAGASAADASAAGHGVAGGAGAGAAAATTGGTRAAPAKPKPVSRSAPSAVSAAVPDTPVAAIVPDPAVAAAAAAGAASKAFDGAFDAGDDAPAGRVVDRFAPPVAAAGGSPLALASAARAFGTQAGGVRQACDAPGAGCRNVMGAAVNPIPNPPWIPGVKPPPTMYYEPGSEL
ncbi:MAG: hypothetical protein GY910_13550 [bacterium]|nr:hypothetical protein [bacterium]